MKPSTDLLGRAALVGAVAGVVLAVVVGVAEAFSLAALVCGFGVAAWAGSVLLAESVRRAQETLAVAPGWTEADARRAFALLGTCGAAGMVATALVSLV